MTRKILIEGNNLFGKRTGIGQYTKRLLESLFAIDRKNTYTIFAFRFLARNLKLPIEPKPNVRYRIIRLLPARVYRRLMRKGLAPEINKLLLKRSDLIIYPNFAAYPTSKKLKKILFIYDISFITHSQFTHHLNKLYLEEWVPKSIKASTKIVTISQNAKREIQQVYSTPATKIEIVYPAVDHTFFNPRPLKEIQMVKKKYGVTREYILFTGTLEPRKNILGVLDSYYQLPPSLRAKYMLVLAGGEGWNDQEIVARLKQLQADGEKIVHTGYLPDGDLPPLYSGAAVFVYPSFYEGFGMPPLEAMSCGVPVITSDNSSLPEVMGEAGIMLKAEDTAGLSNQLKSVLNDPKLADTLRQKGLAQAQKFTWEKSADKLFQIIEEL